ncbi:MAG: AAA family ATPase [Sulfolobales archaeon]
MIIRRVELENVLSHEKTEVVFSDGIVSIVGPNGAGKSTIVEAIYLALLVDGRPDIRGGKTEFIVTKGKRNGRISVYFEIGGKKYIVERKLDVDSSSQAKLYEVNESGRRQISSGAPSVVKEIGRLLDLANYTSSELRDLIRATIFSLQDELTQIIDVQDSERKKWILSLLGLSYLEKALDNVKDVIRDKKIGLDGELKSLKKVLEEAKNNLKRLEKELSSAEDRLSKLLKEKEVREREVKELDEKLNLVRSAIDTVIELRKVLVLRKLEDLEGVVRRLSILKDWNPQSYDWIANEIANLRNNLRRVDNELREFLEKASQTFEVPIDKLEELRSDIERRIRALKEQEGGYRKHLELLRDFLNKFELSDRCPVCGSRIDSSERVKKHLVEEASNIEEKLEEVTRELKDLEGKLRLIDKTLRNLRELLPKKKNIEENLGEKERELEQLEMKAKEFCTSVGIEFHDVDECIQQLKKLREEFTRAENELDVLRSQVRSEPTHSFADLEELFSKLVLVLNKLGLRPLSALSIEHLNQLRDGELEKLRRNLESDLRVAQEKLSRLSSEIEGLKGSIVKTKELIGGLKVDIEKYEREIRDAERKSKVLELLGSFSERYLGKDGEIAKRLTKAVREGLEKRANRILSKLELPNIAINDEFQIFVKVPEGEVPIKNASGGERVGVSIALRLALAELVMGRSPTTLILDEPTVYLDSERRGSVFDIIKELSKSLRQLIVVTHDDTIINISDRVIRVEKAGGVSKAVPEEPA